jgi:phosphatidylinositol glycan class B
MVATVVSYVLVHSLVGHKELRFVLPIVPLALGLAGAGLGAALDAALWLRAHRSRDRHAAVRAPWTSPAILALAALLATAFAYSAGRETLGRLGEPRPELSDTPPWHHVESWNRLLSRAGEQASLCGVTLVPLNLVFTGGYSYLHRDVPLLNGNWIAIRNGGDPSPSTNGLIAPTDYPVPRGFREVAREGGTRLLLRDGGCAAPPPGYSRDLPLPPGLIRRP